MRNDIADPIIIPPEIDLGYRNPGFRHSDRYSIITMKIHEDREKLIEKIGIDATDAIQKIQDELVALREYLQINKVYGVGGWKFMKRTENYLEMMR